MAQWARYSKTKYDIRIWYKEVLADDRNVFKKPKLSKAKYHMIDYSIIFVWREKIWKKTWEGKVRKKPVLIRLHMLPSMFCITHGLH